MQRRARWASVIAMVVLAIGVSLAQQTVGDYLDVFTVQVKPEKRAEFDALIKKMVAANRQNNGDLWVAMQTEYGPGNRVTFVSTRHSYAEVEQAQTTFNQAVEKALGKAAAEKMFQDFDQTVVSSRSEIRRRRWDLSSNAPTDAAAYAKLIGGTRWLRTVVVHVKPGQVATWETLAKELKMARDKSSSPTVLVSQAVAGQEGTVFYVTTLESSLAGFDNLPMAPQLLGDEGYQKFLKTNAETVSDTETVINRYLPELSNVAEQVVAVAPDYWRPKSAAAPASAKGKAAKSPVVPAGEKKEAK